MCKSALYCDMMLESRSSPLLSNGLVNTFPQKQMHATVEEWLVFSVVLAILVAMQYLYIYHSKFCTNFQ
jgi:hypothetical protein